MKNIFHKSSSIIKFFFLLFLILLPANGLAYASQKATKYYLPSYAVPAANDANITYNNKAPSYFQAFPYLKASSILADLKGPDYVKAGVDFTITLVTGEDFPLLLNQEVSFFESFEDEAYQLIGRSNLDEQGKAELKLNKTTAGKYKYNAILGPFQNEIEVTVLPSRPSVIRGVEEVFFHEAGKTVEAGFLVEDSYGNIIKFGNREGQYLLKDLLEVSVTGPDNNPIREIDLTSGRDGILLVKFLPVQKGDYVVESSIKNTGISAATVVKAREFGDIVGISFIVDDEKGTLLHINDHKAERNALELRLLLKEEHGFTKTASPDDKIIFSTNSPELVLFDIISGGRLIVKERGKPGIAIITATYLEKGKALQDSVDLHIARIPAEINLDVKTEGLTAKVEAVLLCKEGLPARESIKEYTISAPPKINIVSQDDFNNGRAYFILEAESHGSYDIFISSAEGISKKFTVNFDQRGKPAKHVVLFIEQEYYIKDGEPVKMNAPPWISYGHVFVPVDFIVDILGVKAISFSSPDKLILQDEEREVIIDKDKCRMTVIKNNSTREFPIGELFLQKKGGSYFVPASDIARIFGARVDYLPKHGNIEHVSFTIPQ